MSNNSHETTPLEQRFAEVFARLREQDIEQFYAHYQLWVLRRRVPLLEKEIEALREHLADHQQTIENLRPSPIALAVLARLQSNGVSNIDLLDKMLDRGEDWLDRMMQRLDYCEQVEDFIQGDYTQWCINSLEGAYDWIDTLLGSIKEVKTQREPANAGIEATEELLLQKLRQDDEESTQEITGKQPTPPAEQATEEANAEEVAEPRELADWENLEDVDLETAGGRSAPWYSVDLETNAPINADQPNPMDDWIKVLQEDTAARMAASEAEPVMPASQPAPEEIPQAEQAENNAAEAVAVEATEVLAPEEENEQATDQQVVDEQATAEAPGEQETISPAVEEEAQPDEQFVSAEEDVESELGSETEHTEDANLPEAGTVEVTGEEEAELPDNESTVAPAESEPDEVVPEAIAPQPMTAEAMPEDAQTGEGSEVIISPPEQPEATQAAIEEPQAQTVSPEDGQEEIGETRAGEQEEMPEQQALAEEAIPTAAESEETPAPAQETTPATDEPANIEEAQALAADIAAPETQSAEILESPASSALAGMALTEALEPQESVQEVSPPEPETAETLESQEEKHTREAEPEEQSHRVEEAMPYDDDSGAEEDQRAWYEYLDVDEPVDGIAQSPGKIEERVEPEKAADAAPDDPFAGAQDALEIHEYALPATGADAATLSSTNHQGSEPARENVEVEGWETWAADADNDKTLPMALKEIQQARQARSNNVSEPAGEMPGEDEPARDTSAGEAAEHEEANEFALSAGAAIAIPNEEIQATSTDIQSESATPEAPEAGVSEEILVRRLSEPAPSSPGQPEIAGETSTTDNTIIEPPQANSAGGATAEIFVERSSTPAPAEKTPPPGAQPVQPEEKRGFWRRLFGWFRRGR